MYNILDHINVIQQNNTDVIKIVQGNFNNTEFTWSDFVFIDDMLNYSYNIIHLSYTGNNVIEKDIITEFEELLGKILIELLTRLANK